MIKELQKNIESEIAIARQLADSLERIETTIGAEKRMYTEIVRNLQKKLILINNSIPTLLRSITSAKPLNQEKKRGLETVQIEEELDQQVFIKKEDKSAFLEQLNIGANLLKKIRKKEVKEKQDDEGYKGASAYGKLSNRYFFNLTSKLVKKGYFKTLKLDIQKSNLHVLSSTYISMMLFSISFALGMGLILSIIFLFLTLSPYPPFISLFDGNYLARLTQVIWFVIVLPLLTWIGFYFYPSTEMKSLAKKIERELPFAVIHMGSIAGSGIQPLKIFKIISISNEYKYAGNEIRKIINQTNIYGHDLTTSLRNVAKSTPSPKLSELLNGMSITISSGGDIKTFFEKRAEGLLLEYKLEREKYTKMAETFMDVYISIVIAAPMILLLLLVMISVSGIDIGLGITQITLLIVGAIALINIVFLGFLQLKQPKY